METTEKTRRQYARFDVDLHVRFRLIDSEEQAQAFAEHLLERPSVWAPPGESELWKLSDSPQSGSDGLLARAILELSAQIERLHRRVLDPDGPMEVGQIQELSCGGARFSTPLLLKSGAKLHLSLMDDDSDAPPVRILAEVVHPDGSGPGYGLAFKAMHPTDKERLTRFIYSVQRRELRRANLERD